jgi:hypothetical protein
VFEVRRQRASHVHVGAGGNLRGLASLPFVPVVEMGVVVAVGVLLQTLLVAPALPVLVGEKRS